MSEWIPIGECLPEMIPLYKDGPLSSGTLLVFTGHHVTVGAYVERGKKRIPKWEDRYGRLGSFTHWMPLPAPPEVRR